MKKQINRKFLEKEITRLDPTLSKDDPSFETALILLASAVVGTSEKKISKFLSIDEKDVSKRGKNLRKGGVWQGNKICCDWGNKKTGGVSFWCDTLVADGLIKRVKE